MAEKRLTAKQKAMREAAAVRMKAIWEEKKRADIFPKSEITSILERVYLAGWHHDKHESFLIEDMLSVPQAVNKIEKLFRHE